MGWLLYLYVLPLILFDVVQPIRRSSRGLSLRVPDLACACGDDLRSVVCRASSLRRACGRRNAGAWPSRGAHHVRRHLRGDRRLVDHAVAETAAVPRRTGDHRKPQRVDERCARPSPCVSADRQVASVARTALMPRLVMPLSLLGLGLIGAAIGRHRALRRRPIGMRTIAVCWIGGWLAASLLDASLATRECIVHRRIPRQRRGFRR